MKLRLVAFDVDGTLYRQHQLRLRMAFELLAHALRSGDLLTPRVLGHYRRIRERLGDEGTENFMPALIAETASACHISPELVRLAVTEWIERRPLRHLRACRYDGLVELFSALRRKGKMIGVLSDYPASVKLQALGLAADHVVCAEDKSIGVLKPDPRGLRTLISAADATPETTLLIGDRPERDGLAARRAGAQVMIRSARPIADWQTFRDFGDEAFRPILSS